MKKIVALVLSLVMVLGLATTAMAVTVAGDYQIQATTAGAQKITVNPNGFEKIAAVTPVDVDEDGVYDEAGVDTFGEIAYYSVDPVANAMVYGYQVFDVNDADYIIYVKDAVTPYMYLAVLPNGTPEYLTGAVAFNDFGTACGQYKYVDYDATETYYLYKGAVYVADVDGNTNFKVGNTVVTATALTGKFVGHTPVYAQDAKGVVTGVSCAKCSDVGVIVSNFAALPTAMKAPGLNFTVPGSASKYFYWVDTAETVAPETDKVESAQTFDAGIAMYVGMSVMAAAGSAVVLKKKD